MQGIKKFYHANTVLSFLSISLLFDATSKMITAPMQLYFTGESLRNVQKFLKLQRVDVSHMAIYRWIKKYVGLMQDYLEQIHQIFQGLGELTSCI
jgi:transposase-like protein